MSTGMREQKLILCYVVFFGVRGVFQATHLLFVNNAPIQFSASQVFFTHKMNQKEK